MCDVEKFESRASIEQRARIKRNLERVLDSLALAHAAAMEAISERDSSDDRIRQLAARAEEIERLIADAREEIARISTE